MGKEEAPDKGRERLSRASDFLRKIAFLESSSNQNTNHAEIKSGMHKGDSALGQYGLMPNTIREMAVRNKDLAPLKSMNSDEIREALASNPHLEDKIANTMESLLRDRTKGDEVKMAHMWQFGHNLDPNRLDDKLLSQSERARRFKALEMDKVNQAEAQARKMQEQRQLAAKEVGAKSDPSTFSQALDYIDSMENAPIRRGLADYAQNKDIAKAFKAAKEQFNEPTEGVPSGKDVAKMYGASDEGKIPLQALLSFNPVTKALGNALAKDAKVSAADAIGFGIENLGTSALVGGALKAGTRAFKSLRDADRVRKAAAHSKALEKALETEAGLTKLASDKARSPELRESIEEFNRNLGGIIESDKTSWPVKREDYLDRMRLEKDRLNRQLADEAGMPAETPEYEFSLVPESSPYDADQTVLAARKKALEDARRQAADIEKEAMMERLRESARLQRTESPVDEATQVINKVDEDLEDNLVKLKLPEKVEELPIYAGSNKLLNNPEYIQKLKELRALDKTGKRLVNRDKTQKLADKTLYEEVKRLSTPVAENVTNIDQADAPKIIAKYLKNQKKQEEAAPAIKKYLETRPELVKAIQDIDPTFKDIYFDKYRGFYETALPSRLPVPAKAIANIPEELKFLEAPLIKSRFLDNKPKISYKHKENNRLFGKTPEEILKLINSSDKLESLNDAEKQLYEYAKRYMNPPKKK